MFKDLKQTWDLDAFFPGGSQSPQFAAFLEALEGDVQALAARAAQPIAGQEAWAAIIDEVQDVGARLRQASAFVSCLNAQNVRDRQAQALNGRVRQLAAVNASVMTTLDQQLVEMPEQAWNTLLGSEKFQPLAFNLSERRTRAQEMLPPEQEKLVNSLAVDGYQGWSDLYNQVSGQLTVPVEENGKVLRLSAGQAANRMSHSDRAVRQQVFENWEEAWASVADACALALNHLAGFRLNLYAHRGWDSVLQEPLEINRMTAATLDAMWGAVDSRKDRLVTYLRRRQELLGLDGLSWHDLGAPIGSSGTRLTYDAAAEFIVQQFAKFNPALAEFATKAFQDRWIEAEDRPGKRAGGFCTSFPVSKQSRIFVTFSGTMGNLATLAHELGHGYHQSLMGELPYLTQRYAMNVAETASTFAELLVADAALQHAADETERIALMDDKLQRAVSLTMNIQSRFLFETRFYEERRRGMVPVARLNELMEQAQRDAYANALVEYHPHFWASKLHFYNTGVPFYNFPYTFGYLFSSGVYQRAVEEGPAFREKYDALLRDTGRLRVEDLAQRHLGVDLTQPEFWQGALDFALADLDEFLRLTR
jgi:oligoendopeptidase F